MTAFFGSGQTLTSLDFDIAAQTTWRSSPESGDADRRSWLNDGYVVLPQLFSHDEIQSYNASVKAVRENYDNGRDAHGFGDRIGQLHQYCPELVKFAAHPTIIAFLKWAFSDAPVLFGSLNFDRGTQQEAHIDAIFFYPQPLYSMAGAWIALEDVNPDAGPLFYLSGSHRWGFRHSEDVVRDRPDLADAREKARRGELGPDERGQVVSRIASAWTQDLLSLEMERNAARTPMPIKAGDVIIWHSLLAHGGLPRRRAALGRKSVVFHFIGRNTKLYTFEQFLLYSRDEFGTQPSQPMNLCSQFGLEVMQYPYFVTYHEGREIVHPLRPK